MIRSRVLRTWGHSKSQKFQSAGFTGTFGDEEMPAIPTVETGKGRLPIFGLCDPRIRRIQGDNIIQIGNETRPYDDLGSGKLGLGMVVGQYMNPGRILVSL